MLAQWKAENAKSRATVKGNTLYLHVFSWPDDSIRVAGLTTRVSRAYALRGGPTLQHEMSTDERGIPVLTIRKPELIDPVSTTLVVECQGTPQVDPTTFAVRPDAAGGLALGAADALILGRRVKLEDADGGGKRLANWSDRRDFVMWDVLVPKAGEYSVELSYARPGSSSDATIELSLDQSNGVKTEAKLAGTGGWDQYKETSAGKITLPAGAHTIALKPTTMPSNESAMNLSEVHLTPIK